MRFLSILSLVLAIVPSLHAQTPAALRVDDVRFSQERSPYGGDNWLEMDVVVDVRGNPSPTAPNREFLDDLYVDVALAHNLDTASKPRLEYFWTQAEFPTLERGTAHLRFYLSPEQVKRGRMITNEPYAWYIRISYGESIETGADRGNTVLAVSSALRDQARLDRFLELLEDQKEDRAGILLPQAETPFRDSYPETTPTIKGVPRSD